MYSTLPYFCARVLVDMPLKIIAPTIFATIAYWSVGLRPEFGRFANAVLTVILLALSGNAIGLFLACIVPDVAIALLVACAPARQHAAISWCIEDPFSSPS